MIDLPKRSETLGIPRAEMPQLAGKHVSSLLSDLRSAGVSVSTKKMSPDDLVARQGSFNRDKIQTIVNQIEAGEKQYPIIVSSDNHVIDGNHRWLAHANLEKDVPVHQIGMKGDELHAFMANHPKATTKKLSEAVEVLGYLNESTVEITQTQLKMFETIVDKLFAPFKLDFRFTTHFKDRLSDARNKPSIKIQELGDLLKKLYGQYKAGKNTLARYKDAEVVLKDLQSALNLPIAIEYDKKNDELDVVLKTIMRKADFKSPDPVVRV